VIEDREQIMADARLVVVHVAGRKYRDFSRRALTVPDFMASARCRLSAKRAGLYGGSLRSWWTPIAFSISERAAELRLTALTTCATTGIAASLPIASVEESSRSRSRTSPFLNFTALARSMTCGKSTFQGCGGTYGHFVM